MIGVNEFHYECWQSDKDGKNLDRDSYRCGIVAKSVGAAAEQVAAQLKMKKGWVAVRQWGSEGFLVVPVKTVPSVTYQAGKPVHKSEE